MFTVISYLGFLFAALALTLVTYLGLRAVQLI